MSIRLFLIGTTVSLLLSWGIWLLVLTWIDPLEAGLAGFGLFFLSLFLAAASTAALTGYAVRLLLQPARLASYRVRPSLRQGVWLGILLNMLLFLQLQRLLRWWLTLIIIVLFLSIELLFLGYDRTARHHQAHSPRGARPA